jgi:SAM-dependent methyltransferase
MDSGMNLLTRLFRKSGSPILETPLPDTASLRQYVLGFCSQSAEARSYCETHLGRLVRTLELTPKGGEQDAILEMGAYMQITPALRTKLGYGEVRGSYLGALGQVDRKTVVSAEGEEFSCLIDLFNAETDVYPYPDEAFATVVCCELIEHLSEDPMHLMSEVNRILRPGGHMVLSTPNLSALRSISAVLGGYHPGLFAQYTARVGGNRSDPRHAREYVPREIAQLLEAAGFTVEQLETGPYGAARPKEHDWVLPILQQRGLSTELREDTIHAVGRKTGPVRERYPGWLYV